MHSAGSAGSGWFVEGFLRGVGRSRVVGSFGAVQPAETFMPLFEALSWFTASRIEKALDGRTEAKTARAIRFAGACTGNRWADALELIDGPSPSDPRTGAGQGRLVAPPGHHWADALDPGDAPIATRASAAAAPTWCWRAADALPEPRKTARAKKGRALYEQRLAGRPVLEGLEALATALDRP